MWRRDRIDSAQIGNTRPLFADWLYFFVFFNRFNFNNFQPDQMGKCRQNVGNQSDNLFPRLVDNYAQPKCLLSRGLD